MRRSSPPSVSPSMVNGVMAPPSTHTVPAAASHSGQRWFGVWAPVDPNYDDALSTPLPWLDRCRVRSIRYRGWIYKSALTLFAVSFLVLGWLGLQPAEGVYVNLARIFSVVYFAFFLLMPWYSQMDKTRPVPDRVTA